jgi:hypothetical protein
VLPDRVQQDCDSWAEDNDIARYSEKVLDVARGNLDTSLGAQQITDLLAGDAARDQGAVRGEDSDRMPVVLKSLVGAIVFSAATSSPSTAAEQARLVDLLVALPKVRTRQIPNPLLDSHGVVRSEHQAMAHLLDIRSTWPLWEDLRLLGLYQGPDHIAEAGKYWDRDPRDRSC